MMPGKRDIQVQSSLSKRTAVGVGWLMVWRMLSRTLGFISTLILVRLLTPKDFGIVALALSITQAVELLSAMGVDDAVVRYQSPTTAIYDTAFTMKILRGIVNASIIALVAWPISTFFSDPRLVPIVLMIALALAIGGFENIGIVEFRRELAYDRELQLRLIPRLAGFVTTIALAYVYRTYWALVFGTLMNRVVAVVVSYTFHPHRPRPTLSGWRDLLGFSLWVWIISIVGMVRDRIEVFVIGRMLGTTAVGMFSLGIEISILPMGEIVQPLASVLFSSFSRAIHDDAASRSIFIRFLGLSALITIPAGTGISLLADPITHVLLGNKWLPAIPLIQVVGVAAALTVFGFLCRPALEARGKMGAIFQANTIVAIVRMLAGVSLVHFMGLIGGGIGAVIGGAVDQAILLKRTHRELSLSWPQIAGCFWRPLLGTIAMASIVMATGFDRTQASVPIAADAGRLVAGVSLGALVYAGVVLFCWMVAGRPNGAETDVLEAGNRMISRLRARFVTLDYRP